jgi:hypothetical protein
MSEFRSATVCGSRRLAASTLPIPGLGHQLRQAGEEYVEARRRRADDRILQARHLGRQALMFAILEQIDVQEPRDPLQLQLCDRIGRDRCPRIDVGDHLDAARVARIDANIGNPADADAQIAHRSASFQAADAAGEKDLVAVVVAVLAGVRVPVDEQRAEQRHHQYKRADRGVVGLTLHVYLRGGRGRARRGNRPGSTGSGGRRCAPGCPIPCADPRSPRHDCRYGRCCPDRA